MPRTTDRVVARQRPAAARQPAAAAAAQPQQQPQQQPRGAASGAAGAKEQLQPLTRRQLANYYFAQHVGLVLCALGIALLAAGYDRGWAPNGVLTMGCLGLCLLGWAAHETRPFNAQRIYEEEVEAAAAATAAAS